MFSNPVTNIENEDIEAFFNIQISHTMDVGACGPSGGRGGAHQVKEPERNYPTKDKSQFTQESPAPSDCLLTEARNVRILPANNDHYDWSEVQSTPVCQGLTLGTIEVDFEKVIKALGKVSNQAATGPVGMPPSVYKKGGTKTL